MGNEKDKPIAVKMCGYDKKRECKPGTCTGFRPNHLGSMSIPVWNETYKQYEWFSNRLIIGDYCVQGSYFINFRVVAKDGEEVGEELITSEMQ